MAGKILYLVIIVTIFPIIIKTVLTAVAKRNVLFIIVDDLRCLAGTNIRLPNIEKMAAKGIHFKNAYSQQSLCAPSRNSLLTGRRPDSLQLYDFYSYWRENVGNFTTLPQYFKENGYETFSVGKIFHPGQSSNFTDDYPFSWSHCPYHPPTEAYKDAPICLDPITKKLQDNLICPVRLKHQPDKSLPDLQSLHYAINVIKHRHNVSQPLFLAVGFHKPHIPLKFPKRYLKQIPHHEDEGPKFPNMPSGLPLVAWHPWSDVRHRQDIMRLNISFPFGTMPRKWTLKIRRSYYAAARYIDDLVGKLISQVDLNKTVVVFTSDHGWSLGENGLWAKYSNFEVALKVPLIFLIPGTSHQAISDPVELVDLFPTIVDLAGYPTKVPKCNKMVKSILCTDGKSLVPMIKSNYLNRTVNSFAISQYPRPGDYPTVNSDKPRLKDITIMGYSIRTKRYRYTEWISFNNTIFTRNWNKIHGSELYDHLTDPDESCNLEPGSKNITKYLSELLRSQIGIK